MAESKDIQKIIENQQEDGNSIVVFKIKEIMT